MKNQLVTEWVRQSNIGKNGIDWSYDDMRRLVYFATAALLASPCLSALADDPPSIELFIGSWAAENESPGNEALRLDVQRDENGFRLAWVDLGTRDQGEAAAEDLDARFQPTARKGVYEFVPESGSLLTRMFASPATGNPLEGETLLWARLDGPTLAVYSMKVDGEGGFDLDHYSWTRAENGLQFSFGKQTEDLGTETILEGELVAKGG